MRPLNQLRPSDPPKAPEPIHARAMDNLRFIRETMERAGSFTAVPGWGGFLIGITAVGAAALAGPSVQAARWRMAWLTEAVLAVTLGVLTTRRKAKLASISLASGPGRRFLMSLVAPLVSGALLTVALSRNGSYETLPGLWLLLYGTGIVTGGAFSVRVVPIMGLCFIALGAAALILPSPAAELFMGLGFGGLHIIFGLIIARKYGG